MLIAAFEVEIAGETQLGLGLQNCRPTGSGVDPDVKDVGLAAELRAAAVRARRACRQHLLCRAVVPCIGAVLLEQLNDACIRLRRLQWLVALLAQEERDGHTPDTLA